MCWMLFNEMCSPGEDELAVSGDVVTCFYFDSARVAFFSIFRDSVEKHSNSPLVFNTIIFCNQILGVILFDLGMPDPLIIAS